MDIRLEILRIDGVWNLTRNGPELTPCGSQREAMEAGILAAKHFHKQTGGAATVHLWHGSRDTIIYETALGAPPPVQ